MAGHGSGARPGPSRTEPALALLAQVALDEEPLAIAQALLGPADVDMLGDRGVLEWIAAPQHEVGALAGGEGADVGATKNFGDARGDGAQGLLMRQSMRH